MKLQLLLLIAFLSFTLAKQYVDQQSLPLPLGTYFLGPNIDSYTELFSYYYYVKSSNPNYYERTPIGNGVTYEMVSILHKQYKLSGATSIRSSTTNNYLALPIVGYSTVFVDNLPNNASLYLVVNSDSRTYNGNMYNNQTLINCIAATGNAYGCLSADQHVMINNLKTNTNIVLPSTETISLFAFLMIIFGCMIVIASIVLFYLYISYRKNRKNNMKGDIDII